jgi:hypothetical protein
VGKKDAFNPALPKSRGFEWFMTPLCLCNIHLPITEILEFGLFLKIPYKTLQLRLAGGPEKKPQISAISCRSPTACPQACVASSEDMN